MKVPEQPDDLFTLADDIFDGLVKYELVIKVKQNDSVSFKSDQDGARKTQKEFKEAEAAKKALSAALTIADSNGKSFLASYRKIIATNLGDRWTQAWEATGFPDRKTAVPGTQDKRESLLNAAQGYLAANPDMQVNTPRVVVTDAQAGLLLAALRTARQNVADGNVLARQKKTLRDAALKKLRARIIGLIDELHQLLEDDDPLWLAFGLSMPGAVGLPDSPDGLVLTAGPIGTVLSDWHNASRATYYRVAKMVLGEDDKFVHMMNVNDSDCILSGLPSGKTVRIQIIAANDAGYSEAIVAEIVVP